MAAQNNNIQRMSATPSGVFKTVVPKLEFEPLPEEVFRRFPSLRVVEEQRNRQLQKWIQLLEKNLGELRTAEKE